MGRFMFNSEVFENWLTARFENIVHRMKTENLSSEDMLTILLKGQTDHILEMEKDFKSEFKQIRQESLVQFKQIDKQFELIDQRFGQVDKRFEQIDKRFEQIDKRFEQIDKRFDKTDKLLERIGQIMMSGIGIVISLGIYYKFF